MSSRKKLLLGTSSVVAALLLAGTVAITTASAGDAGGRSVQEQLLSGETSLTPPQGAPHYPVNAKGQTYGSELEARTPAEAPDLIAAIGNKGIEGYVLKTDYILPMPKSPEEAVAMQKAADAAGPRTIPVYASDGKTVVDTFTFSANTYPEGK